MTSGEEFPFQTISPYITSLVFGFLRDGSLIGFCLFFVRLISPIWERRVRWEQQIYSALGITGAGALLIVMMGDVEYFRYFGSHSNFTHIRMLLDANEGLAPVVDGLNKRTLYFILAAPTFLFFLSVLTIQSWKWDWYIRSKKTFLYSILMMLVGSSVFLIPQKNTIAFNLTENYAINFAYSYIVGDELSGYASLPIRETLKPLPLDQEKPGANQWQFVDENYPLIKATDHQLCVLGKLDKEICGKDEDGDGVAKTLDCNDHNTKVYPGAHDIPRNGLDEDCSGIDADPPNVIFIHWEGARAVDIGSIGYASKSTPRFDKLVKKQGFLFRNAYANGTQTRWSLTSIYNSILPRLSSKWIFKHNPTLNILAFPAILRDYGYETFYIHGGDIGFGNFRSWFWQWFDQIFDRTIPPLRKMARVGWGPPDRDTFNFSLKTIIERKKKTPFYMSIATLSMHYPFLLPEKKYEFRNHRQVENKIPNIMRYCDETLADFIEAVLSNPQLENTIIIVAADHGLNGGYPHNTRVQNQLWQDLVWVPMALFGKNWNMPLGGSSDEIRQVADIGPTILDRLGIEVPNHFIGHSLLRKFTTTEPVAFFGNANGGLTAGVRYRNYKYWVHIETDKEYLFDLDTDVEEKTNLAADPLLIDLKNNLKKITLSTYNQNTKLIKKNKIWRWDFWIKAKKPLL